MPKKDPVTGCMVMTMPEFLNDMAEKEGKGRTGGDVLADIYAEIDADSRRCEDEIRKPEEALNRIRDAAQEAVDCYWYDDEDAPKMPDFTEVVHVIEVSVGQSMRSSGEKVVAEVKTADGRLCYVFYTYSHWSGTMLDPPEDDSEFYFGEFRPMSEHPWKCFQCGKTREKGDRHWSHTRQSDNAKNAVHSCPRCNGYEREKNKRRLERLRRQRLKQRS